jgi:TolB-like protein/Tfp pilus assembly protein PilF
MKGQPHLIYEFGPLHLDTKEQTLLRDGQIISLTPKAYDTLLALVQEAGHTLGKDYLLEKVWHGTYVTEATLAQNVSTLRKILGERPGGGLYIETVPKRGYRFVGPMKVRRGEDGAAGADAPPAAPGGARKQAGADQERMFQSLAILPFTNASDDSPLDYLSEGITESLINMMTQLGTLKVAARSVTFRHRGERVMLQEVGHQLGVEAVLCGRVMRFDDRLVIRAELVDVASGWQLWGEQYDREVSNILAVQIEIAGQIAAQLRLRLASGRGADQLKNCTENPEAYKLYLQGRYYWNKHTEKDYGRAIDYYRQAITVEPDFALAYAGLADTHAMRDFYGLLPSWEMIPKAKAAVMKALELDDQLGEAHAALAFLHILYQYDWESAEEEFKLAIKFNPRYALAHQRYAHYLLARGRFGQALVESSLALELEPFDLNCNLQLGWYYVYTRQYEQAIEQLRKTLNLNPEFWAGHVAQGIAYEHIGMFDEAVAALRTAERLGDSPLVCAFLGHAYAVSGRRDKAREMLDKIQKQSERHYVPSYCMAVICSALGETDRAFEYLEKSYELRNQWLGWIKVDPELDGLRSDVRFTELLARLGLPPETGRPRAARPARS